MFFRKVLVLAAILGISFAVPTAQVKANPVQDADWIITLQTEELKGVLDFKNSRHKNPVKVHVTYWDTKLAEDKKVNYEDIWYNEQGMLIGQEKHHALDIRANEQVILRIKHKNAQATNKEYLAAGEASLRVYLDATLRRGKVTAFRVPLDSFNDIAQAIMNLHYSPYNVPPEEVLGHPKMVIYLASEPVGQNLYLQRN